MRHSFHPMGRALCALLLGATLTLSPLAAQAPAATAQASPAQVTNNYTLNIDGRQLKDASPRVREMISGLFGEFGITAEMGV